MGQGHVGTGIFGQKGHGHGHTILKTSQKGHGHGHGHVILKTSQKGHGHGHGHFRATWARARARDFENRGALSALQIIDQKLVSYF
jgi:hypothetical protein